MSNDAFLNVSGLSKRFGRSWALRGVDLHVGPDELLVVLGPTGAGKTTLLRTLAGLERPDEGAVTMAGQDVTKWAPAPRDVALVFQNFSLYPDRTVRQNMEFPLRAPGRAITAEQIAQRVQWAAQLLRIDHLLDRKSTRLSGGEMQRVAIGRAIVRSPRMFLMDEPLTNLDAKLRESLRVELLELRRRLKIPMVYVTHDQAEAMSMGDRIVVLSEGRVLQTGTSQDVYRRPASPAVARQLGQPSINLVQVERRDGFWCTPAGQRVIPASDSAAGQATLGIRPEDIEPAGGQIDGTVKVVENMGPALVVLVDCLGTTMHLLADKSTLLNPGQAVRLNIKPSHVVVWES